MAKIRRLRLNLLGVVSLVIGAGACVAARMQMPFHGYGPVPIALLGLGVGVFAYLLSMLFGRSGTGFPVLGILASVGALVLVSHDNGSLARWIAVIHPAQETPKTTGVQPSTPGTSTPGSSTSEISQEPDSPHVHSIFDTPGSGGTDHSGSYKPKPAPLLPPVPIHPDPLPESSPPIEYSGPTIPEARAKLDTAYAAVERSLTGNPAYTEAKAAADAADARRKLALSENGSGSPEVLAASKDWLDAKSKLQKIISAATSNDPASLAAQRELTEAQAHIHTVKPSGREMTTGRRIFITVAEVSGDKHAAQLIRELRKLDPTLIIEGIGGPEMAAAGATIHRNTVIKAAMGWRGILRAREMYRLLRWTRKHFDAHRPDLWIGVDSPSMNFHFARIAHDRAIPTLQYVAPQLWAWAIWRMKKLRRWVDAVACILPFEEGFFREHGVNAVFVGHPLFDELPPRTPIAKAERFPHRPPVIGLLAGSRKSEGDANFPGMLRVAEQISKIFPKAIFLTPTTAATYRFVSETVKSARALLPDLRIEVGQNFFDEMVSRCDLCITVSGTATLHVASFNVPMIVVYRVNQLAWKVVGQWMVPTRTFALVNVLAKNAAAGDVATSGGHIVPEFVPWEEDSQVANLAIELLNHPEKLEAQRQSLDGLIRSLDHPGASGNVAKLAMEMIAKNPQSRSGKQEN